MADVCHACGRALPRRRIEARDMEQTGWGCPTVFEWTDQDGNACYFRLRNGYWRLCVGTAPSAGTAPSGVDGVCSWDEAVAMVAAEGIDLVLS